MPMGLVSPTSIWPSVWALRRDLSHSTRSRSELIDLLSDAPTERRMDSVPARRILPLAEAIATAFGTLPQVAAVALAGSFAGQVADAQSDIDIYVYADTPIPVDRRTALMLQFTAHGAIGNQFWEPGDEW